MRNIADFIRRVRAKMGITQLQLAEKLECTKGNISAWENELHAPSYIMLAKMAEMSGVPMPHDQLGELLESMNIDYKNLNQDQLDMIRSVLKVKQEDIETVKVILSPFAKKAEDEHKRRSTD